MAKVRGAYFSHDAAGRIGRHMLVSRPYGVQVARRVRLDSIHPAAPTPSAAQVARRVLYAEACDAWQLLTPEEKVAWQIAGDLRAITGFNAFVSDYLLTDHPKASGGIITESGGYFIHTFNASADFIVYQDLTAEVLVVAGGGGGGRDQSNGTSAGGGGAGGLIWHSAREFSPGTYPAVIGLGGLYGTSSNVNGANGQDSTFAGMTAKGGGGGSSRNTAAPGVAGGCGGGGEGSGGTGGASTQTSNGGGTGYGYAGGNGSASTYGTGGGGGGTGAAGNSIHGGNGRQYDISGEMKYYGGGGAGRLGSSPFTIGTPGLGGGGGNSQSGEPNTGGGGGFGGGAPSGSGGSGVVILRYPA